MRIVTLKAAPVQSGCAINTVIYKQGSQSLSKAVRAAPSSPRLHLPHEGIRNHAGTKGEIKVYDSFFIISQLKGEI